MANNCLKDLNSSNKKHFKNKCFPSVLFFNFYPLEQVVYSQGRFQQESYLGIQLSINVELGDGCNVNCL